LFIWYDEVMRSVLVLVVLTLPVWAGAFDLVETDQSQPYEIVPVEAAMGTQQYILGTLTDYPIMYEIQTDEQAEFVAEVRQLANKVQQPLALLLVRVNDRGGGVQEIARMNASPSEWARQRDQQIGLSFSHSPGMTEQLEPGRYRLEVSSPENTGTFLLAIGEEPTDMGYWDTLSTVRQAQAYFGYGPVSMLASSLVYRPLFAALFFFGLYKVWQFRHRRAISASNHTTHAAT